MKYLVITLLAVFMAFANLGCDEPATETDEAVVAEDSVEVVEEVVTEEIVTETVTEETVTTETVTEETVTEEIVTPVEEVVEGEQPVTQ